MPAIKYSIVSEKLNKQIFFWLGFTPCRAEQALRRMELQEAQKRLQDTENLFRKNLQLKDIC